MSIELKPCPICGMDKPIGPKPNDDGKFVVCGDPDCWATTSEFETVDAAINQWNNRRAETRQPDGSPYEVFEREIVKTAPGADLSKVRGYDYADERTRRMFEGFMALWQIAMKRESGDVAPVSKGARKCPQCRSKIGGHPNKKFCGSRCKDKYHNEHNPRGYYLHLSPSSPDYDPEDDMHPFDGLNTEDYKGR